MTKFNGDSPMNARIDIDYTGKMPQVKFSYPDKKHQVAGSMYERIKFLSFALLVFPLSQATKGGNNPFILISWIIFFYWGLPILVYYPFKKQWDNFYPKYMAFFAQRKYKTFIPKDIIVVGEEIYCEIPLFNNILCNYEGTKDFSKYLTRIKIHEYEFETRNKKGKGKKNEWLWFVRFYFSQVPKEGKLEVVFS